LRQNNADKDKSYNKAHKQSKRKSYTFLQHEQSIKKRKVQGFNLADCIKIFEEKISNGPSYIYTCCHQTWFCDSVVNVSTFKKSASPSVNMYLTNLKSVEDKEWICHTCLNSSKCNKIPLFSIANKMGFPEKPKELDLYPLEERLISLRIPFIQIRQLPRGGQFYVKGNVVNLPVDIQPTINYLPCTLDDPITISVKLKKKPSYKSCDFRENVRPYTVICGLHYLMKKRELYKSSGKQIDKNWIKEIIEIITGVNTTDELEKLQGKEKHDENAEDAESDHFSEVDNTDIHVGNTDTLLDEVEDEGNPKYDTEYVFAPGGGQRPLGLYCDSDAEYLSFPSIFCGQRRADNKERSVHVQYTDIVKWELRSMDRQVAQSVPNIFFKLKKFNCRTDQTRQI
jgi:hypothetical protein